jgi:hypothetical protein
MNQSSLLEREAVPNSRFLYKEAVGVPYSWQGIIRQIDLYIEETPSLHLANQNIILYFFSHTNDEDFHETGEVWVGREITGLVQLSDEEIFIEDFTQTEVWQGKLTGASKFEDVFDLQNSLRLQLERREFEVAETWRLVLKQNESGNWEYLPQFFLKKDN